MLIASTDLIEPTFRRSVVYMMEHNGAGSLGVVINQMSQAAVHNLLPRWTDLAASPRALFVGGPVKRDAALCLGILKPGMSDDEKLGARPVDGRVVLIDLDADPELLADRLEGVRIFAGYAGWGPGQLESELADGSWLVASALPGDILALKAAPRLVVLLGCSTARAGGHALEDMALAQAFISAGSQAVIATARNIRDEDAAWLAQRLYQERREARPALLEDPAAALQAAQRALRKDRPTSDWSAFRVYVP